jgi:hypothetical protein
MGDRIMPKKYYKAEEIINILRQIEILVSHIAPMSFGKDKQPRWQPEKWGSVNKPTTAGGKNMGGCELIKRNDSRSLSRKTAD